MLQITVHNDHRIPRSQLQACKNSSFLSEIPGKLRSPYSRILGRFFLNAFKGSVLRTITDKYQLIIDPVLFQQFPQYFCGIGNILFFVICR